MLDTMIVAVLVMAVLAAAAVMWSYKRFAATRARLLDYIKTAAPEITVVSLTDIGFTAQVLGTEIDVDLAALARRRPTGISDYEWFDRVIAGLRAQVPVPGAPPYLLIRDRIVPQLKPRGYVEIFEQYPPAHRLVWRPFVPGVAITYVINNPHDRIAVTVQTLEVWGESPDALHTLAVENLRANTAHLLTELDGPQARYEHLDGLDATRILVADLLVPPGIADPVIAIPEETVMLIATASEQAALAAEAAARHKASTRPISSRLFRVTRSGPVPVWEPQP